MNKTLLFSCFLWLAASETSIAQDVERPKNVTAGCIAFYNVENLYDTLDTPNTDDFEFTPAGPNKWNTEKYKVKLDHLSEVLSQLGTELTPDGAAVIGLAEIENDNVLNDLVKESKLKKRNYNIVHFDGPDRRGVDVALLYNPKYFKVTNSKSYRLTNPEDSSFRSRDQLMVSGTFDGEPMHFIVTHWPSRRGGEKKSQPLRILAAKLSRSIVDSILKVDPNAKVIFMGDLNDDPNNVSLTKYMQAADDEKNLQPHELYNTMADNFKKGIGTLAHQDAWNLFDQMLITPQLIAKNGYSSYKYYGCKVYNKSYLMSDSGRYKGYPFRTYSGGTWTGGYSDHFPVYLFLVKEKK